MAGNITGVSGTIQHNQAVVIGGSGFGAKATAAPLLWDDFEDGVDGEVIPTDSDTSQTDNWTYNVGSVVYSSEHSRAGSSLSSKHDLSGIEDDPYGRLRKMYWQTDESLKKLFLSFWVRYSWGDDVVHQTKLWRVCNADNSIIWKNGHWVTIYGKNSIGMRQMIGGEVQAYYHNVHPADGEWFKVELQAEQSSQGVSDGSIEQWHTRPSGAIQKILDLQSVMTTASQDSWHELIIGQACTNVAVGVSSGVINYFDDVYLDNTWARVVIGDASTYDACTTRETQIPTAWADGSITVAFNQGAFADGAAYLYVVDEDGVVSPGYPITIGAGAVDGVSFSVAPAASPSTVESEASASCSATATDPLSHDITYAWQATGGSFNNAALQNPTWTAPVNESGESVAYTLSCRATCSEGEYAVDSCQLVVNAIEEQGEIVPARSRGGVSIAWL